MKQEIGIEIESVASSTARSGEALADGKIREVGLSAGAGFVVVTCGENMTMPDLPRLPAVDGTRLNVEGGIVGLFRGAPLTQLINASPGELGAKK